MTENPHDARIRAMTIELAESAPAAPTAADLGIDADGLATYAAPLAPRPRPRQRAAKLLGAALATLGLAGGGGFAIASLGGDDGGDTPEAAVEHLVDSLVGEDAIGVLEALAPNERDVLVPTLRDAIPELERIGLLEGLDLSSVGGFDFEVVDLELASRPLADDLAAVRITSGSLVSSVDATEIPLGPAIATLVEETDGDLQAILDRFARDVDGGAGALVGELQRVDFEIVVVDDDGWHVSLQHTAAEAARKAADLPPPDFAAPLTPVGAESPEEAVRALMQAAVTGDLATAVGLVDPVELPALYDYGSVLLDQIEPEGIDGRFTAESIRVDGDGGERRVVIDAYRTEIDDGTSRYAMSWDGSCLRSEEVIGGETIEDEPFCVDDPDLDAGERAFLDLGIEVVVSERDGRWYVSLLRSTTQPALDALRGADPVTSTDDVYGLVFSAYRNPVVQVLAIGLARTSSDVGSSVVEYGSEGATEVEVPAVCRAIEVSGSEWEALPEERLQVLTELYSACFDASGVYGEDGPPPSACFADLGVDPVSGIRPDEATLAALGECLLAEGRILGPPPEVCAPFEADDGQSTERDWDRRERCLFSAGYYPAEWGGYLADRSGGEIPAELPAAHRDRHR